MRPPVSFVSVLLLFCSFSSGIADDNKPMAFSIVQYQEGMQDAEQKPLTETYMVGLLEGFTFADGVNILKNQSRLFCPPTNFRMTPEQDVEILDHFLSDTHQNPDLPVAAAMLTALRENFPCT